MPAVTFRAQLEAIVYDLRFAWRGLRRDRAFTLTAIAMLTLAIGLNVSAFAVMDTMLFRGLPLTRQPDRLVYLSEHRADSGGYSLSYPDFEDWRTQSRSFEDRALIRGSSVSFKDGDGRPLDTTVLAIGSHTFRLLGVQPIFGRDLAPGDEKPGAPLVVILNYRFWMRRFGERADIVGSRVYMNGSPATIIGVMPERFDFTSKWTTLWTPLVQTGEIKQRGLTSGGSAIGRLRDGVSLQQARAELETINHRLELAYPTTNRGRSPRVTTLTEYNSGADASIIWGSLWAGACLVFFIACANLANLSLVRSMGRAREYPTRIALGAGQARMIRLVFMESLTIAVVAGAAGWWIAKWCVHTWDAVTSSLYQVLDYSVDWRTFSYLASITLGAAILFSIAPMVRVIEIGVNGVLKGEAHGVGQRTKEIGVRMAIGATVEDIRRMIVGDGMLPVAAGTILGLAASLGVNRVLQSQLVGVSPYDPATTALAPSILAVVAMVACRIPARPAMNVDPAIALRRD